MISEFYGKAAGPLLGHISRAENLMSSLLQKMSKEDIIPTNPFTLKEDCQVALLLDDNCSVFVDEEDDYFDSQSLNSSKLLTHR